MLRLKKHKPTGIWYRPGTCDENVIIEVVTNRCYRKARLSFDVEKGEHWLDLGGNIGTFAYYCHSRGATCDSYEPDETNFAILQRNLEGTSCNAIYAAVTGLRVDTVTMHRHFKGSEYRRDTVIETKRHGPTYQVPNVCIDDIPELYDGIKMDIEGSEFSILDNRMLPKVSKLVLEYHFSRDDKDIARFRKRLKYIKSLYREVHYPAELDRDFPDGKFTGHFDRNLFCFGD